MKSRFFAQVWLSLLLLFAQQIALADAISYASHAPSHHQCTYDEGASADADSNIHFGLDNFDNGLVSSYVIPVLANGQKPQAQGLFSGFCSPVSPHYLSRAPPLL
jgi:hypothetical protein